MNCPPPGNTVHWGPVTEGSLVRKVLALLGVVGALTAVAPVAAGASTAKIPPACITRTAGKLHIQIGYCP